MIDLGKSLTEYSYFDTGTTSIFGTFSYDLVGVTDLAVREQTRAGFWMEIGRQTHVEVADAIEDTIKNGIDL